MMSLRVEGTFLFGGARRTQADSGSRALASWVLLVRFDGVSAPRGSVCLTIR